MAMILPSVPSLKQTGVLIGITVRSSSIVTYSGRILVLNGGVFALVCGSRRSIGLRRLLSPVLISVHSGGVRVESALFPLLTLLSHPIRVHSGTPGSLLGRPCSHHGVEVRCLCLFHCVTTYERSPRRHKLIVLPQGVHIDSFDLADSDSRFDDPLKHRDQL